MRSLIRIKHDEITDNRMEWRKKHDKLMRDDYSYAMYNSLRFISKNTPE